MPRSRRGIQTGSRDHLSETEQTHEVPRCSLPDAGKWGLGVRARQLLQMHAVRRVLQQDFHTGSGMDADERPGRVGVGVQPHRLIVP